MSHREREVIGVDDRVSPARAIPLGIQHMMSMFGSTVLVPVLTGLDPNVAIMCSGIGTICYLLVTGNKIPSYLGSSFAFISPILAVGATRGLDAAMSGVIVAGAVFLVVAGIIKLVGTGWLDRLLPPVLVASVMVVIGVGLSATAANMAFMGTDAAGASVFNPQGALVAAVTLLAAVIFSGRGGIVGTVPVLLAIIVGYAVAVAFGMVDFAPIAQAAWIGLPSISFPKFDMGAIALIAPVAVVTVIEHIGHLLAVGEIVDKDYRPLLPRSLAGDGLSTMISGFLGGPPTTTYAENIGVMSVTRVYSTQIFWYAGGFALIVGGLCPKLAAVSYTHLPVGERRALCARCPRVLSLHEPHPPLPRPYRAPCAQGGACQARAGEKGSCGPIPPSCGQGAPVARAGVFRTLPTGERQRACCRRGGDGLAKNQGRTVLRGARGGALCWNGFVDFGHGRIRAFG